MFGFIKKMVSTTMTLFSCNAWKYVSMNNQECEVRPEILNVNSNESSCYPYSILVNKCSGSCNVINPYTKLCVSDVKLFVKDTNIKLFNLMPRINEIRHVS